MGEIEVLPSAIGLEIRLERILSCEPHRLQRHAHCLQITTVVLAPRETLAPGLKIALGLAPKHTVVAIESPERMSLLVHYPIKRAISVCRHTPRQHVCHQMPRIGNEPALHWDTELLAQPCAVLICGGVAPLVVATTLLAFVPSRVP